jgi:phosphoribosylglycinamide formyltransferase-1
MNLGFLASHQGSNMQAVIDSCRSGFLQAQPSVVISNNSESEALARAKRENIPNYHLSSNNYPDPEQLDQEILKALRQHCVNLVILAGYMKKLGKQTLSAYHNRIINIHPALLPKYGGQGMYGRYVHEAVINAGEKETGVTIHLVDENYDNGVIISQLRLPVNKEESVEALAGRILEKEHEFLVETLHRIIIGELLLPTESKG